MNDYHEGRAVVRITPKMALLLCPYGHVVTGTEIKPSLAGSHFETLLSNPPVVKCYGTLPKVRL